MATDKSQPSAMLYGFIRYMRNHPIGGSDGDEVENATLSAWRRNLHERVLDVFERHRGRPAARRFTTGIYLPAAFATLQSRARFMEIDTEEERERSPDRNAPPFPDGVPRVLVTRSCPHCNRPHRCLTKYGRSRAGTQRFMCECGKTTTRPTRSPYTEKCIKGTRIRLTQAARIRKRFKSGESITRIAKLEACSRSTVRKALAHYRLR